MKARITTLLSLTGVLVAGSAAALVNTQVLQSSALRKSNASEISVADTQPPSPTTGTQVANKFAQLGPSLVPTGTQTTYAVGTACTVVLDNTNGVLSIVSVTPASADWQVGESESDDDHIDVKCQSATQLIEFKASIVAGEIVTSVETTDLTTTSVSTSSSTKGGDDGDDDQNETEHHGSNSGNGGSNSGDGGNGGGEKESGGGGDD
jgi:uncharacterized membrane protein YgcG